MSSKKSAFSEIWSGVGLKAKVVGAAAVVTGAVGVGLWYYNRSKRLAADPMQEHSSEGCFFPALVQLEDATQAMVEAFAVDAEVLALVASGMKDAMVSGLLPHSTSSLKMLPTYVDKLTVRAEGQVVLALDMGGTNLRVMQVQIHPGGHATMLGVSKHSIPQQFMVGSGTELFDFIASCVLEEVGDMEDAPLGFTFSFPTQQDAINSGRLVEWTKGFTASGVEGRDVAGLLNAAFASQGRNFRVTALVNDTVGTMLTGAFTEQNDNTLIGLILGTGSNACYMESAENIGKWEDDPITSGRMIINIEWGNFDSPIFSTLPANQYDVELDQSSLNPNKQHYEKMLSGMYLGEIARLVLQDYCAKINLFGSQQSAMISTAYRFPTHFMSQCEADGSPDLAGVCAVLRAIGIQHSTLPVRRFVKTVCSLVATRSARLAAAGVTAIVRQMERTTLPVNVAIDGSVFELYPGYQDQMRATLKELGLNSVTLSLAKDGSGLGAALTAAIMGP